MTEVTSLLILLLLACAGYTAGRVHAQFSYRIGYRFGYRQGYFDGDRASWNRRRRELQAAVASVLKTPAPARAETFPAVKAIGTTYTSTTYDAASDGAHETAQVIAPETAEGKRRPSRRDLVEAASEI